MVLKPNIRLIVIWGVTVFFYMFLFCFYFLSPPPRSSLLLVLPFLYATDAEEIQSISLII